MTKTLVYKMTEDRATGYRAASVAKPEDVAAIVVALSEPGYIVEVNCFTESDGINWDSIASWENEPTFFARHQTVSGNTEQEG